MAAVDVEPSMRDALATQHERIERLLEQVAEACAAKDWPMATALWSELERELLAHLALEEDDVLPLARGRCEVDTRALAREHEHIRSRLRELGVLVRRGTVRSRTINAFAAEIQAHTAHENNLL